MTPAEHAALSAQLARALGWPYIGTDEHCVFVTDGDGSCGWFDYRDPSVALPVLEWLMQQSVWIEPCVDRFLVAERLSIGKSFATLPEAIARAAIAVMEGK